MMQAYKETNKSVEIKRKWRNRFYYIWKFNMINMAFIFSGGKLFNKFCYFNKIVQLSVMWKVIKLSPMLYIIS